MATSEASTPSAPQIDTLGDPGEALLRRAETSLRTRRRAEAEQLTVAREWALVHRKQLHDHTDPADLDDHQLVGRRNVRLIGAISVPIWEYAPAELALALQLHPLAAQRLMADAVDLHDRLPHTWAAVMGLRVEAWVARKIVTATGDLDLELAQQVDAAIADSLGALSPGRLLSLVEARVLAADQGAADVKADKARRARMLHLSRRTEHGTRSLFARCDAADATRFSATADQIAHILADANGSAQDQDPETLDQLRARAVGILADPQAALDLLAGRDPRRGKAVVYVHTTHDQLAHGTGAARAEGFGPHTVAMLKRLLGHDHVTLKPVIDLNQDVAADCYETPAEIGERLHLTKPADVFPWAESLARGIDMDHTVPWDPHGPPGQTTVTNLGKMTRRHHRIKTHARGWHVEQLSGHRYLWTTPHRRTILVDHAGTHPVQTRTEPPSAVETHFDTIFRNLRLAA